MARITLKTESWRLEAGLQVRGKFGYRKMYLLAGSESLQMHGLICDLVGAVRHEEGYTALHRVLNLVAERTVSQVDEHATPFFTQHIGEGLRGGNIARGGRAEIKLRLVAVFLRSKSMCF